MGVFLSLSVLAILLGLFFYSTFWEGYGKVQELGRLTYFAGLVTFLLQAGPQIVNLLGGN